MRELERRRPLAVGAVLLAMREAGMWRRVEREAAEIGDVVRVDAISQLVVGCVVEARDQNAGQGAESDIDHIVARTAAAERPARIVTTQRSQAALAGQRASAEWSDRSA